VKKCAAALLFLVFCASCATTVDVEKRIALDSGSGNVKNRETEPPRVLAVPVDQGPPEVVVVEKPVYIPQGTPYTPPKVSGTQAVQAANSTGILSPSEYQKAAMIYDYDADWVYEVYCQPLRATDVQLESGERVTETPFISDSERWMLGAGISVQSGGEVQHIYIKPTVGGLEASLIINTDRRVYHIILKSFQTVHMPMVRWRYRSTGMPNTFSSLRSADPPGESAAGAGAAAGVDPRYLSFNYKITYGFFNRPRWLPDLVYDDGRKTYITFPADVLQSELPAVFENRSDVINYRVLDNIIVIDKRIEKITIRKENQQIVVEKKKAGR
jgi:type IV secretion system protein VirB9